MSNFGEDGLQKLVFMRLFAPGTFFLVSGTLKIGGGVVASPSQGKKNLFLAKKMAFFGPFLTKNVKFWRRRAPEIGQYELVRP